MWMHAVPIMALSMIVVYRLLDTELAITMVAAAIVLRDLPRAKRVSGRPAEPIEQ
jgi:hypothetical protein